MKKQKVFIALTAIALSLATVACTPTVQTRGNLVSDIKFERIQPYSSSRADVSQLWGPPTTVAPLDQNTWYYIGETISDKGVRGTELVERRMIRVKFDDQDTVVEVVELDPSKARAIEVVDRKTPTAGKEFTAFQQFIGNLGKFNTEKK